jgi:hypothetical protein
MPLPVFLACPVSTQPLMMPDSRPTGVKKREERARKRAWRLDGRRK